MLRDIRRSIVYFDKKEAGDAGKAFAASFYVIGNSAGIPYKKALRAND